MIHGLLLGKQPIVRVGMVVCSQNLMYSVMQSVMLSRSSPCGSTSTSQSVDSKHQQPPESTSSHSQCEQAAAEQEGHTLGSAGPGCGQILQGGRAVGLYASLAFAYERSSVLSSLVGQSTYW